MERKDYASATWSIKIEGEFAAFDELRDYIRNIPSKYKIRKTKIVKKPRTIRSLFDRKWKPYLLTMDLELERD